MIDLLGVVVVVVVYEFNIYVVELGLDVFVLIGDWLVCLVIFKVDEFGLILVEVVCCCDSLLWIV